MNVMASAFGLAVSFVLAWIIVSAVYYASVSLLEAVTGF